MLQIRAEQMRALGEAMQRDFEDRMAVYLRVNFQAQVAHLSGEQLLAIIREGILKADRYGITIEKDVARFIEYSVVYGPDFHTRLGWVATVLGTGGINGTQKMDRIDNQAPFRTS
jgi:hypothetical protein